jgi:catechol 2,3-dioxygenase-like lactoylglutathione lyase family enzyme
MFGLQIDHVAFSVPDPEATARWYEQVLGLDRARDVPWPDYPVMMRAGATAIALFPSEGGRERASAGGSLRHLAFRTDRPRFLTALAALRDRGIPFEREDHAICESVYLADPDGHEIELTTYEKDEPSG